MRQLIDAIRYGAKAEGLSVWRFIWRNCSRAELFTAGVTLGIYVAALFSLLYMVIDYV